MKKSLISLVLIGFLTVLLVAPIGAAATGVIGVPESCYIKSDYGMGCSEGTCLYSTEPGEGESSCGACCMVQALYNITDTIFVILIALATVFVILGAIKILMAKDSQDDVEKGRKYITSAAIGLIVAFLAKAIPQAVKMALGA